MFEPETVAEALRRAAGIQAVAARMLGCHRETVAEYIKRHPEVREVYHQQRETLIDLAEQKLVARLQEGDWPAIRFVLEFIGRHRYGAGDAQASPDDNSLITPDVRAARVAAILKKAKQRKDASVNVITLEPGNH